MTTQPRVTSAGSNVVAVSLKPSVAAMRVGASGMVDVSSGDINARALVDLQVGCGGAGENGAGHRFARADRAAAAPPRTRGREGRAAYARSGSSTLSSKPLPSHVSRAPSTRA